MVLATENPAVREVFVENCSPRGARKFGHERLNRRDRFRQIFIQIEAILAIFGPFAIFAERPTVALTALDLPWTAPDLPGLYAFVASIFVR